jgi:hypothetical protein
MKFFSFLNLVIFKRFIKTGAMTFTRKTVNRLTINRTNDTEENDIHLHPTLQRDLTLNNALDNYTETIAQMSPIKNW